MPTALRVSSVGDPEGDEALEIAFLERSVGDTCGDVGFDAGLREPPSTVIMALPPALPVLPVLFPRLLHPASPKLPPLGGPRALGGPRQGRWPACAAERRERS